MKVCKICNKELSGRQRNLCSDECKKENNRLFQLKWMKNNPEKTKKRKHTYYQNNKLKILKKTNSYYQNKTSVTKKKVLKDSNLRDDYQFITINIHGTIITLENQTTKELESFLRDKGYDFIFKTIE